MIGRTVGRGGGRTAASAPRLSSSRPPAPPRPPGGAPPPGIFGGDRVGSATFALFLGEAVAGAGTALAGVGAALAGVVVVLLVLLVLLVLRTCELASAWTTVCCVGAAESSKATPAPEEGRGVSS